jgi:hypothetical protein
MALDYRYLRKLALNRLKNQPRPKPKVGEWVRLKSLEEVCKVCGVGFWEDVYDPEICDEMIYLFGTDVKVVDSGSSRNFKALDHNTGNTWFFNTRWIDENPFETEGLSDDLFEI